MDLFCAPASTDPDFLVLKKLRKMDWRKILWKTLLTWVECRAGVLHQSARCWFWPTVLRRVALHSFQTRRQRYRSCWMEDPTASPSWTRNREGWQSLAAEDIHQGSELQEAELGETTCLKATSSSWFALAGGWELFLFLVAAAYSAKFLFRNSHKKVLRVMVWLILWYQANFVVWAQWITHEWTEEEMIQQSHGPV